MYCCPSNPLPSCPGFRVHHRKELQTISQSALHDLQLDLPSQSSVFQKPSVSPKQSAKSSVSPKPSCSKSSVSPKPSCSKSSVSPKPPVSKSTLFPKLLVSKPLYSKSSVSKSSVSPMSSVSKNIPNVEEVLRRPTKGMFHPFYAFVCYKYIDQRYTWQNKLRIFFHPLFSPIQRK